MTITDEYLFIPLKDSAGNDVQKVSSEECWQELLNIAEAKNYLAFNTYGYFKDKVIHPDHLDTWSEQNHARHEGLFISKRRLAACDIQLYGAYMKNYKKLGIKIVHAIPRCSTPEELIARPMKNVLLYFNGTQEDRDMWVKMSIGNSWTWENIRLIWYGAEYREEGSLDHSQIDYYMINNFPKRFARYNPERTLIFQMEPPFTRQIHFPDSFKYPNQSFLHVHSHEHYKNLTEWQLSWDLNTLLSQPIQKTKVMSMLVAGKIFCEGHAKRLKLYKYIDDNHSLQLFGGKGIDVYGKPSNVHNFKNYQGYLPHCKKDDGLFPYQYTIECENCSETGFLTEKLTDAILAECLCFYDGCPNAEEFIDPRAFIRINVNDCEKTLNIIHNAIQNNEWEKRLCFIREMKYKILTQLQVFPTLQKCIFACTAQKLKWLSLPSLLNDDTTPKFFVVTFKESQRIETFEKVATQIGLEYEVVMGASAKSTQSILNLERDHSHLLIPEKWNNPVVFAPSRVACMLSHYHAIKRGVENGLEEFGIIEDDATFIHNFKERYQDCYDNLPDGWQLFKLYQYADWNAVHWTGQNPSQYNLVNVVGGSGAIAYILKRDAALHILEVFKGLDGGDDFEVGPEHLAFIVNNGMVSEHLQDCLGLERAYCSCPPLTTERGNESYLRTHENMQNHVKLFNEIAAEDSYD